MTYRKSNLFGAILYWILSWAIFIIFPSYAFASFVQSQGNNAGYPPVSNAVSISMPSTTIAGDLMIVSVGWGDQTHTVLSVTDSSGNTYQSAAGPTGWSASGYGEQLFYSANIKGGADTVIVTMSGTPAVFLEARAYEYAGPVATSPLDAVQTAIGSVPAGAGSLSAGPGFTARPVANGGGMMAEDELAGLAGEYAVSMYAGSNLLSMLNLSVSSDSDLVFAMTQAGGGDNAWVMQAAAFKTISTPFFVGRTQNTVSAQNASVSVDVPTDIEDGDLMLVVIDSWNSAPQAPAGWALLGSSNNSMLDSVSGYSRIWHAGDPDFFSFGPANYPKAVMRVYRGAAAVDAVNPAPASTGANTLAASFSLPALPATSSANDLYVAFFANDNYDLTISGPSGLSEGTADQTQWASFDGDQALGAQGTIPAAEIATITGASSNWIGFAVTLTTSATPTPSPTPTSTPTTSASPTPSATPTTSPPSTPTPPASPVPTPVPSTSIPTPTPTPTSTPTATATPSIAYIGYNQSNVNSANASVTVSTPSGIQNGDLMLIFVSAWNTPASPPTAGSWSALGSCNNSSPDYIAAFAGIWTTGSPSSYTLTGLNYPKAIMRVYRGASGVDAWVCAPATAGTNTYGNSITIPALPATAAANDEYVAAFFNDGDSIANPPSDLSDGVADATQWASFVGDKAIAAQGTIPPAESANN